MESSHSKAGFEIFRVFRVFRGKNLYQASDSCLFVCFVLFVVPLSCLINPLFT